MPDQAVNIKPLKGLVATNFPVNSIVRTLILEEPETMPAEEYVIKVGIWLRILRRNGIDCRER